MAHHPPRGTAARGGWAAAGRRAGRSKAALLATVWVSGLFNFFGLPAILGIREGVVVVVFVHFSVVVVGPGFVFLELGFFRLWARARWFGTPGVLVTINVKNSDDRDIGVSENKGP